MYIPIRCDCGREVGWICLILRAMINDKIKLTPVPYLRMVAQESVTIGKEMTDLGLDPVRDMCCRKTVMTYQEIHNQ